MRHKWDRMTVQEISDKAEAAFWAAVAEELPGVPGDVEPFEARSFSDACFRVVDGWTQNAASPLETVADLVNTGERIICSLRPVTAAPRNPDAPGLTLRQRCAAKLEAEG